MDISIRGSINFNSASPVSGTRVECLGFVVSASYRVCIHKTMIFIKICSIISKWIETVSKVRNLVYRMSA